MTPRIVVIEHEAGTDARRLGDWLEAAGAQLDVRRPYEAVGACGDVYAEAALARLPGLDRKSVV